MFGPAGSPAVVPFIRNGLNTRSVMYCSKGNPLSFSTTSPANAKLEFE
jgi:hypothetical protein